MVEDLFLPEKKSDNEEGVLCLATVLSLGDTCSVPLPHNANTTDKNDNEQGRGI